MRRIERGEGSGEKIREERGERSKDRRNKEGSRVKSRGKERVEGMRRTDEKER